MRAGDLLRQLEQRLLPRLTGGVARLGAGRARVLISAALVCCAVVLLTAVWAGDDRPSGDRTVGEVTRVGVAEGESIPGYVRAAAADLAALPTTPGSGDGTYALVSLSSYLTPQRVAAVLGDVPVATVFGRVPLADRQTEIVRIPAQRLPDDLVAQLADLAARKDREAADQRARAATLTGGGPQEHELRQVYASGAEVAAAEAVAYRSGCACVYAAVVRAGPVALRGVAARAGVRAVDPAPEVSRLDRTVFTPPLPEQREVVRPPADGGLSPATTPQGRDPGSPGASAPPPAVGETSEPAPGVTDPSPDPAGPASGGTPLAAPATLVDAGDGRKPGPVP
ncbi:hypothetical protein [Micromonospora peucetia]|uniref:Uncharacterized protein n=1 Tax=Micromonospora peucetia TaxID=47871 RepID=A0A1C6VQL6_9ACTN|nr:hypothetical protein [Micromonospora peucetia]WSA30842.1 hypothetical protein OIE14_22105 [Micromonospora peucetia]SCL68621.1 hypothetical protein GA0070608_3763 [Micromonospora peucetia]